VIRKIGLTGGIASGKSRVAGMLAPLLNCVHLDADETCRQLLEPEAEGWQGLTMIFGSKYITEDGSINRSVLRKDLFTDEELRRTINSIIHPLVKREIITQMDRIIAFDSTSKVLVEVPLLYEVGWENLFDTVVVVYADYETCLNRLMDRDGKDKTTAAKEMESQLDLAEKVIKADYVIDNSGVLSDTNKQVKHLADLLNSSSVPGPA
jgi:dephospho-CoA kinase